MTDLATIPARDGGTYLHERDGLRLAAQHQRVLAYMSDGQRHTLGELARMTGDPEASVSARLRDLRKPKFGGYTIKRFYVARGLHEYQLCKQGDLFDA